MSKTAKRLGRGLQSLVSDYGEAATAPAGGIAASTTTTPRRFSKDKPAHFESNATYTVSIDKVTPNKSQPRSFFGEEELHSLAASIRENGVLQPIAVRVDGDQFEIIAGERRWRAASLAGLDKIPVIILDASNEKMLELALVENIQREDLNAIERANAYGRLAEDFGLSHEEIGRRLGEDRTTVANYLRLLDLPDEVQAMVADGRLGMGHARAILGIADQGGRTELADAAIRNQLSVRALESLVRTRKVADGDPSQVQPVPHEHRARMAHLRELERRFEDAIKSKVTIREGHRKGSGRIIIEYYSLDDFDRMAQQLGVRLD